jgi:hypothetical protein
MAGSSWSDALRAARGPFFGRHLQGRKLECRRNRAADQRPVAQTVSRLPSLRGDNDLGSCAPHEVGSKSQPCCRARIMQRNLQLKRGAGMIVPDLHSIDLVPAGALTSRQQEINGARWALVLLILSPSRKVSRKWPPSGCGLRSSNSITSAAERSAIGRTLKTDSCAPLSPQKPSRQAGRPG